MNEVVIDASVVLRWAFEDEADRAGALAIASRLVDGTLQGVAPPTFLPEVAGVLVRAVRAGRITAEEAEGVLTALVRIAIDAPEPHGFAMTAMRHALQHDLHVQGATYLETARRRGAPLISADEAQLRAADRMGLTAMSIREVPETDT